MAISTIPVQYETYLMSFSSIVNKLGPSRINLITAALVGAATGVTDLINDVYAALRTATGNEKYGPEVRQLVWSFEQHVRLGEKLGLFTDVIVAALTTVNTAAAATDLRHCVASVITINGYDRTREDYYDAAFAYSVTAG
jgi:hypothetical protein